MRGKGQLEAEKVAELVSREITEGWSVEGFATLGERAHGNVISQLNQFNGHSPGAAFDDAVTRQFLFSEGLARPARVPGGVQLSAAEHCAVRSVRLRPGPGSSL